ncbi:MurR/RpiR family transcriptional regulator [Rhizobium mongolense]|uniref:MurR/RpiR family transcriptional regulator n=1 Tax=Rhizobium mongolense TaxID=57676 RepID=UPI0034A59B05
MISDAINTAPNALARIAFSIFKDPEAVLTLSIADLARNTGSGSASIIRFCRMLGFSGFREFKIALSGEIERRKAFGLARPVAPEDVSLAPRVAALSTAIQNSIAASAQGFDELQICDLANRVRAARRVEVFGTGPSSICADILAMRLIWLGLPVHSSGSASMTHGLARALDPSSLAIGVSSSGHTAETKNFLDIARKAGAYTIAITTLASGAVADAADEVILFTPIGAWPVPGSVMHVPSVVLLSEYLSQCVEEAEAGSTGAGNPDK